MKKWSYIFLGAAVWNFVGSLRGLYDIKDNAETFYLSNPSSVTPVLITNLYILWWSVFAFGIGYLIVAANPLKNHGLVLIAILGKSFVGVMWIQGYFTGEVGQMALLGGIGDILFSFVFAFFLYGHGVYSKKITKK